MWKKKKEKEEGMGRRQGEEILNEVTKEGLKIVQHQRCVCKVKVKKRRRGPHGAATVMIGFSKSSLT